MAWAVVEWAYKQIVTSAKLAQMVENLRVHDHRADGTQGSPLVGAWTDVAGLTAAAGWSISGTPRYRIIATGVYLVDLVVTRTGAEIRGSDVTAATPGNVTDTTVATGWPTAVRPAAGKAQSMQAEVGGTNPATVRFNPDGSLVLIYLSVAAPVATNDTVTLRGHLWGG